MVYRLIIRDNPPEYPEEILQRAKLLRFNLILFFVVGAAYAKGYEANKKVGEYEVRVKIDSKASVIGDARTEIQVKEAEGGLNILTSNDWLPRAPCGEHNKRVESWDKGRKNQSCERSPRFLCIRAG